MDNLLVTYKLRDFLYEAQKKEKQCDRMMWRFRGILDHHISRRLIVWAEYIQHVTFADFTRLSQSDAENRHRHVHDFVTPHTNNSILFFSHAKQMLRYFFYYIHSFFLLFFINIFNWHHFYLAGYGSWTRGKPDKAFCWNACVEWWPSKRGVTVHG